MYRSIIHFDADAFFASVEQATDPSLRGKPIAVGGEHRGIVSSASYEARKFGVYTPMPMSQARRICPNLIVVPGHFELYEQFSASIFAMADELSPLVEKQGLDEGYLDLTGMQACLKLDAAEAAEKFRCNVKDSLKVTISQGLSRTKLLSQIASKLRKPDALTIIPPDEQRELAFLHPLPVKWLPGIGATTERLLQSAGLSRIEQVANAPLDRLSELVGSYAEQLHAFANNIDDRPVENAETEALSYGHQETFAEDIADMEIVDAKLRQLADEAMSRVRADGKQIRTVTVKVRYPGMEEHQGQASLAEPTDVEVMVYPLVSQLLCRIWDRRLRVRMVQVKLSNIYEGFSQLDLFGDKQRQRDLALACEAIRNRFGGKAMMRAHDWVLREDEE